MVAAELAQKLLSLDAEVIEAFKKKDFDLMEKLDNERRGVVEQLMKYKVVEDFEVIDAT